MVFATAATTSAALRHGTVGYPLAPGDEVRLLIPGTDTDVAFGEVGELCFRSPGPLTCYFGDPDTTACSFTADVRLVAMPDPILGEKACACLITHAERPPLTMERLGTFLLGLDVAKYKLPERIEIIDAFPLTRVGKVDEASLRAMVAAKVAAEAARQPGAGAPVGGVG